MHFSRKSKKTCSYIVYIFWKRALKFKYQQEFHFLQQTDLNANHFHSFFFTSPSNGSLKLRTNGVVTPTIMDFRISFFLLIWYDQGGLNIKLPWYDRAW